MTDLSLFDFPVREVETVAGLARWNDADTAKEAAARITGKTERLVLQAMGDEDWIADELCHALPTIYPPTLKSALSRLANHKLIVETGATRLSDRGCKQLVWRRPSATGLGG